jgi:protein-S-isoprenylcysteine O-methyltransferase Ste14
MSLAPLAGRIGVGGERTLMDATLDRGPGAPLPPTPLFVAGFVVGWWLHRQMAIVIDDPGPGRIQASVGLCLIALGGAVFCWGLATFVGRTGIMLQRPATALMTSGPYQWSRNPQYVAFTAIYIGAALLANNAWPLFLLPLVLLAVVLAVITREERYLRAKFGETYDAYCQRVGRWL